MMKTLMLVLVAFLLSGCDPTNYEDCRKEAAKMPTNSGVSVALGDCTRKFVTEPAEKQREIDHQKLKSQWAGIIGDQATITLATVTDRIGKPTRSGELHVCIDKNGNPTESMCRWYEWTAKAPAEICETSTPAFNYTVNDVSVYRAEFIEPSGRLTSWYADPLSHCKYAIE